MDAGWRADPEREGVERWFDGVGWTEHWRHVIGPEARMPLTREPLVRRAGDSTRWLNALVGSPVAVGMLYWFVSMLSVPVLVRMQPVERPLIKLTFLAVVGLVLVGVAALDARELRARGFVRVPSVVWAFGTPILYLAKRGRIVDGADRVPLVIHLVLLALSVLGVFLGVAFGIRHLAT